MRHIGCLLLVIALAGCARENAIPYAGDAPATRPANAPARPAAAVVTAFDGRYSLRYLLNPDRARSCPPAPASEIPMVVEKGQAMVMLSTSSGQGLTGRVGEGGDLRMADRLDRTIATNGSFAGDRFVGEHRNATCTYAVTGSKAGR